LDHDQEAEMRTRTWPAVVLSLALGCVEPVAYRGTAVVEAPDLAEVGPGVRVIADYDEPIFFADGLYWWFYEGAWYRSAFYTGGWTLGAPPVAIVRIGPPRGFIHYRPHDYVVHRRPVPIHRIERPAIHARR
jgi:hypothetical protein